MTDRDYTGEAAIIERRKLVWEMKLSGLSITAIANQLHLSRSTIYTDVSRTIEEMKPSETTIKEWRILISDRLDLMLEPLMKIIKDENTDSRDLAEAIRAAVKIEERRAKMLGIDKPSKIDVTHHLPALDPPEAARRQRRRLEQAGFSRLSTRPPIAVIEAPKEIENVNGNRDIQAEDDLGTS